MAQDTVHAHNVEVRWSDFDMYGHMMNANYIEIAQEARLAFAKDHFYSQGVDLIAFVRHIEAEFLRPLVWDGRLSTIRVETSVVRLGTTSFTTRQEIKDPQGNVACVVNCTQVTIDKETQKPRPVSEEEKKIILEHADVQLES
ncbi:acyl-CoA thioesterase [Corynebacterium sp.]|uniref:acyl-CoA thioesterase n=1 Tax=Corynebacterium sp. TaxID=1720 RepID=UPI0034C5D9AA